MRKNKFIRFSSLIVVLSFLFLPISQVLADARPTQPATSSPSTFSASPSAQPTPTSPAPSPDPSSPPAGLDPSHITPSTPLPNKPTPPAATSTTSTPNTSSGIQQGPSAAATNSSGSQTSVPNLYSEAQVASPKVDQNTGALTYSYPITIPPGRSGMQPALSLDYNNQNTGDGFVFGTGWTLSIPYIERVNRTGTNNLYTQNYFTSSVCGDLISADNTNFGCRTENGDFLKFSYSANTWTVTDKKGTTYLYGSSSSTRLDNPGNSAQIFRWMLEKITDTNNNYVKFSYTKDSGQIYPSSITYTGNGSTDGPFSVQFVTQTRPDQYLSYKTGFAVTTNSRVSEIDVSISGTLVHKYALAYTAGDNGARSLLSSITETGYDESGVATTLPAVSFTYTKSTLSWTEQQIATPSLVTNGSVPYSNMLWNIGDNLFPVSGSALADIIQSDATNYSWSTGQFGTAVNNIYTNNGDNTWTLSNSYTPPYQVQGQDNRGGWGGTFNEGISFGDLNGDLMPDFIKSQVGTNGDYEAYVNTVGTGWVKNTNWNLTIPITDSVDCQNCGTPTDYGARILDLNGDGLADVIRVNNCGSCTVGVQLNSGAAFGSVIPLTTWGSQIPKIRYPQTRELDLNGDGIADFTQGGNVSGVFTPGALLGDGTGNYTQDNNLNPPLSFTTSTNNCDLYAQYLDLNGDGLPDYSRDFKWNSSCSEGDNNGTWGNYLNTANGWNKISSIYITTSWGGQQGITQLINSSGFIPADINGDGLIDFVGTVQTPQGLNTYAYIHSGVVPDLLSQITYSQGGSSSFTYKGTPQYKDGSNHLLNPKLPLIIQTVSSITTNDSSGNLATTSYSYSGGTYYYNSATDRKFAGFQKVVTTDPAGNVTDTFYHTQNGTDSAHGEYADNYFKIGKPYRIESYNSSNSLFKVVINKWDSSSLSTGGGFVFLAQTVEKDYDGTASHNDEAISFTYDSSTGNTLTKTEYGKVSAGDDGTFTDTGSDLFTTTYAYASGGSVVGLPDDVTVTNQGASKVKESKYLYDNAAFGSVSKGNVTEQDDWISGSTYAANKKTYDGTYGLVTLSTDANNHSTTYTLDSLHLYPATAKNALNQQTSYTYNYQYGKVDQTTDPNGFNFRNVYDGLGRMSSEQQPDLNTPTTLVNKTTYVYVDSSGAVSVQKNDWMDGSNSIATYSYFDGLNRIIQQRTSAEDSGSYNVKDFKYNNLGFLSQESLPYTSAGSAKTSPTTTAVLLISYSYDPLSRIASVANTLGTTSSVYTPWKVTVTDPNGHAKDLIKDAYDNLVQVNEYNGSIYTTTYAYDYLKDLTSITDALGNVRNFSYDGLGRRLSAQDLHPSSSASFGTWTYVFDNAGNLTQKNDPNGNHINYVYDFLNRITTEKLGSTTKATYVYDTCTDGVGRLCTVTNPSVSTANTYNALGFLVKAVSTIAATPYETDYSYDRQQHQTLITNPDSSQIQYTYNLAGLPETVQRKESTDSAFKNVVTNFDYSPLNDVSVIAYANGATTTNTYDSTKLYRLTHKVTALSGSNLQDIAYTYDPVGNITQITDNSATDAKKNIAYGYDNLNRLTSYTVTSAVNGNNHSETYSYDAPGNITSKSDQGTYSYGGTGFPNPDAVTAIGSNTFSYDNNGNMLTASAGSGLTNTWDYNNRLTQSVVGSGQTAVTVTYGYDQNGERVTYSNGTTSTVYPTKLYNVSGTNATKHIFANGQMIATITGTGASAAAAYINTDHLTGSNVITNDAGTTKEVLDYYPFGASRLDEQTGFNEQRKFAGHEFDGDTGLSYMDARYYNPTVGRFESEDPLVLAFGNPSQGNISNLLFDPQNMNAYSYSDNNPILKVDPSGQYPVIFLQAGDAINSNSVFNWGVDHPVAGGAAVAGISTVVLAAPGVAAGISLRTVTYGFLGGLAAQYLNDVSNNLVSGQTGLGVLTHHSDARHYVISGTSVAGTSLLAPEAAPLTIGSIAAGTSFVQDRAAHEAITGGSVTNNIVNGLGAALTEGLIRQTPGIPGRLPGANTAADFVGAHALANLAKQATSALSQFVTSTVGSFVSNLLGH